MADPKPTPSIDAQIEEIMREIKEVEKSLATLTAKKDQLADKPGTNLLKKSADLEARVMNTLRALEHLRTQIPTRDEMIARMQAFDRRAAHDPQFAELYAPYKAIADEMFANAEKGIFSPKPKMPSNRASR